MADRAECRFLLDIFNDPARAGKVYEIFAKELFGRIVDKKKNPDDYFVAKQTFLATDYNAQWFTLQQNIFKKLGVVYSEEKCREAIERAMRIMPEVKDYIWEQRRRIIRDQEIACETGWVRHLPNDGPDADGFKHAWNQGVNVEIQHVASMLAKLWANLINRELRRRNLLLFDVAKTKVTYLGPVHDSVSHDCRNKRIAELVVREYREQLVILQGEPTKALIGRKLRCPLAADIHVGPNWKKDD